MMEDTPPEPKSGFSLRTRKPVNYCESELSKVKYVIVPKPDRVSRWPQKPNGTEDTPPGPVSDRSLRTRKPVIYCESELSKVKYLMVPKSDRVSRRSNKSESSYLLESSSSSLSCSDDNSDDSFDVKNIRKRKRGRKESNRKSAFLKILADASDDDENEYAVERKQCTTERLRILKDLGVNVCLKSLNSVEKKHVMKKKNKLNNTSDDEDEENDYDVERKKCIRDRLEVLKNMDTNKMEYNS